MRFLFLTLLLASALAQQPTRGYIPKDGFVPDQHTAIRIAEAVLTPIYGEERIQGERPFRASLEKDVWTVEGFLPPGTPGGTAVCKISKKDGRVLFVMHYK
jgi:hypothetical protein